MAPPSRRESISLLLVEDEALALKSLATTLSRKFPGATVHAAANGRQGLELFKAHAPDVVITDINMPEMGGGQMADEIRAIRPGTKFIAISGESRPEFERCIVKPVVFRELCAAIEQCLAEIGRH